MSKQEEELERLYTVPLSRAWITARHRRTRRAINILREFAIHHMKSSEIKIDTELNEELWKRGITRPPRRITVKMEKDEDGVVTISLPKKAKSTPTVSEEKESEEGLKEESKPAQPSAQSVVAASQQSAASTETTVKPAPEQPKKASPRKKKTSTEKQKSST